MNERLNGALSIKYKQIYTELKDAIQRGQFIAGSFLPTESQLMKNYGVSRTTIRRAMAMLEEEGYIRICQGRGTEVLGVKTAVPPQDRRVLYDIREMTECFLKEGEIVTSSSAVDMIQADTKIAAGLQIEPLTQIYRIQRLKYCGEIPYDYVVSYVPCAAAPGLERYSGQVFRLKQLMKSVYQLESIRAEETFYAAAANFTRANLLHVTVGEPLMVVCHTAYGNEGIIEYTESYMRSDVYRRGLILGGGVGFDPETSANEYDQGGRRE